MPDRAYYHDNRRLTKFARFDFGYSDEHPNGVDHIEVELCFTEQGVAPAAISSSLMINEGDEDWEWDQRDQWNSSVDTVLSTLLIVFTHNPQLLDLELTRPSTMAMLRDIYDALGNQF